MDSGFDSAQLTRALEAMLFVTSEPVSALVLADNLDVGASEVEAALRTLAESLEGDNRGIQLREVAGGWRLYTHPAYHELIERYVLSWDTRKLSAAAMETLAIIAYTQPVTRSGVAHIRGVNSDSTISSLVEKRLVCEVGCADAPGNPTLYGTTHAFLEKFGLKSVADLPPLEDFAPDDATRLMIAERLSATRSESEVSETQAYMMADQMLYGDDREAEAEASKAAAVSTAQAVGEAEQLPLDCEDAEAPDAAKDTSSVMDEAFRRAIESTLGVVEKIDLDKLDFDFDEE